MGDVTPGLEYKLDDLKGLDKDLYIYILRRRRSVRSIAGSIISMWLKKSRPRYLLYIWYWLLIRHIKRRDRQIFYVNLNPQLGIMRPRERRPNNTNPSISDGKHAGCVRCWLIRSEIRPWLGGIPDTSPQIGWIPLNSLTSGIAGFWSSRTFWSQLRLVTQSTIMVVCTRTGCGKTFDDEDNNAGECMFHPGGKFSTIVLL